MDNITKKIATVQVTAAPVAPSPNVTYAIKKTPGTSGMAAKLVCNAYTAEVTPNIPYYKFDVEIVMVVTLKSGTKKEVSLVRTHKKDIMEKVSAFKIVHSVVMKNDAFFKTSTNVVVYDRAKILFSTGKLSEKTFELLDKKEFETWDVPTDAEKIIVKITPCAISFQANSNDLKFVSSRTPKDDKREVLEFLQLLVANEAFKKFSDFTTIGRTHYLNAADPSLPRIAQGQEFKVGFQTTVHVKEGFEGKKPIVLVVADVKKTTMHLSNQSLFDKISSIARVSNTGEIEPFAVNQVNQSLKGVSVETTYGHRKQKFSFHLLGECAAKLIIPMEDGSRLTGVAFFKKQYNIELRYPKMPMVKNARGSHFPVELLKVTAAQIVPVGQTPPETQQLGIRLNAIVPNDRKVQIGQLAPSVGLVAGNQTFLKAGVKLSANFLQLAGRILQPPKIKFLKNGKPQIEAMEKSHKWQSGEFLQPGAIVGKWAIVALFGPQDMRNVNLDEYVQRLTARMSEKGIKFEKPEIKRDGQLSEGYIVELFEKAKEAGVTFMFFIESDNSRLHDFIKTQEQKWQIMTQAVKASKAARIQNDTLTNVVHKTTMKLGGLCYGVELEHAEAKAWLNSTTTCYIGLEFSHAPPQNALPEGVDRRDNAAMCSVVGWGANCASHPQKYVGDYAFVNARDNTTMTALLTELIEQISQQFKAHRGDFPKNFVIYFNGISEGQWPLIAVDFFKSIFAGCKKAGVTKRPSLTLIAVSKAHELRIFKENTGSGRAPEQNVVPGTVVDSVIVSPAVSEFYLNSHQTLQGSACTPKYSVIIEETNTTMDTLENVTHGLCCLHEIVNATVSTPAPLMVADRSAERGHKNYVAANRGRRGDPMGVAEANEVLRNPQHGRFEGVRYNA